MQRDPDDTPMAGTQAAPPWRGRRVLLVDDNHDAAETLSALLAFDGEIVRTVHDGPAAVAEAERFEAEYILMDIGLPGFSGLEATRRIRRLTLATRPFIIALTGRDGSNDPQRAAAAGCDRYLVKPVPFADILAAMQSRPSTEHDA